MKPSLLASCVVIMVAASVVSVAVDRHFRTAPAGKQDGVLAGRLATLEASDAEARERLSRLERRATPQAAVPAPKTAVISEEAPAGAADPKPPSREGRTDEELAGAYEAKFISGSVDRGASSVEREYRASIDAKLPPSSHVTSFECRSEYCRLEVIHESVKANNGFIEQLFLNGPLSSIGFRASVPVSTDDGKLRYIDYIARPGVSLALDP